MACQHPNPLLPSVKLLTLVLALACVGAPSVPSPVPAPPPTPVATPKAVLSTSYANYANKYLVILGSKRDPKEAIPGLKTLAAHPELGLTAQTLSSSQFKNLMPCYTVTYAGSFDTLADARKASSSLTQLGVENYVKNTGAWVGVSAGIEAWCARSPSTNAQDLAVAVGGMAYVPVDLPAATQESLLSSAPKPRSLGETYDSWSQPLSIQSAGELKVGEAVSLAALEDGKVRSCVVTGFEFLTLGTPHFSYLQDPPSPPRPACGEPKPYARLDCTLEREALAVRLPAGAPFAAWPIGAEVPAERVAAVLDAQPDFKNAPEGAEKTVKVHQVGEWLLVEANVETEGGICGGEAYLLAGLFDNQLKPVVPLKRYEPGEVRAVAALTADGKPALVLHVFMDETRIVNAAGKTVSSLTIDFCDCPC